MPTKFTALAARRRGRPRKFAEPSRAVTLTLPEDTLQRLASIDRDTSHAIVRLLNSHQPSASARPPAELVAFGHRAVISIRPTPALERRVGVELVPLPDGRALISFDQPRTIADLELTLADALEERLISTDEREVFEHIGAILRDARRSNEIHLLRRNIIVLQYGGRRDGDETRQHDRSATANRRGKRVRKSAQ